MDHIKDHLVVASHQAHFFPWLGYLDKMAKADLFLINDIAQIEKKSPMTRNRILSTEGKELYVSVPIVSHGAKNVPNAEVLLSTDRGGLQTLMGRIQHAYYKTEGYADVWPRVESILLGHYTHLIDVDLATIEMLREFFDIHTPIVLHSSLGITNYTDNKSENIAKKCAAVNATCYLSGNGARKYMEPDIFSKRNIQVCYQQFTHPYYPQRNSSEFIPNLSALDMLFNCGIEESRRIFWENVKRTHEFNETEA